MEAAGYTILPTRWGVEIEGLEPSDATEALRLLRAARRLQSERGSTTAANLIEVMAEADLDLTPPAAIEQARKQADRRRRLLASPVYTNETLGELLGHSQPSTTRTWVSRKKAERRLFTVKIGNQVIIPAFQLNAEGKPRAELAPILDALLGAGVDGWTLWTWLVVGTPLLSGGVPVDLMSTEPTRVRRAAQRFASRHRPAA
ncbi:hypothetical protein [Microlunatus endophyticus]|nr:hypothetical protein [Microlunatus endophyticus]